MTPQSAADHQPGSRVGLPPHLPALLRPRLPHHVQDQAAEPRADDGDGSGPLSFKPEVNLDMSGVQILHTRGAPRGARRSTTEDISLHRGELKELYASVNFSHNSQ